MESVTEWAEQITRGVCSFWRQLEQEGNALPSGVSVFYGPVRKRPEVMIVGINPGGGCESFDRLRCEEIPSIHEYITYESYPDYPIAGRMCELFRRTGRFDLLERSVKLNLNFFRTTGEGEWNQLPRPLRQRIRVFCDEQVNRIIAYLAPRVILAEGLSTFNRLRQLSTLRGLVLSWEVQDRRLYRTSETEGQLLIGIRHPTGPGRPGKEGWKTIGTFLKADLSRVLLSLSP
jgi:hypothetical protein